MNNIKSSKCRAMYWIVVFFTPHILVNLVEFTLSHPTQAWFIPLLILNVRYLLINAVAIFIMWKIDKFIINYITVISFVAGICVLLNVLNIIFNNSYEGFITIFSLILLPLTATSISYSLGFWIKRKWLS